MSRLLGEIRQNGYVVRDVEAAMRHWSEVLGVGPFFYFERVPIELVTTVISDAGSLSETMIASATEAVESEFDVDALRSISIEIAET